MQGTDLKGRWTAGVSCQAALEMLLDDELDIEGYTVHHAQPSGMFIGTVQVLHLLTSEAQAAAQTSMSDCNTTRHADVSQLVPWRSIPAP